MNRTLLIQIDMENAAFEGDAAAHEALNIISRGFGKTPHCLPVGEFQSLRDSNGNTVGTLRVCLMDDEGREVSA